MVWPLAMPYFSMGKTILNTSILPVFNCSVWLSSEILFSYLSAILTGVLIQSIQFVIKAKISHLNEL